MPLGDLAEAEFETLLHVSDDSHQWGAPASTCVPASSDTATDSAFDVNIVLAATFFSE